MRHFSIWLRLSLALIVVVAIGLALFLRRESRDEGVDSAPAAPRGSAAEPPASSAEIERTEPHAISRPSKAERRPVPGRRPREPKPGSEKVWKGTITFLDPQVIVPNPPGRDVDWLTLGFVCFAELHPRNVVIRDGRFECVVPFVDKDIEEVRVLRAVALGKRWLPEDGFEKVSPEFEVEGSIRMRRAPVTHIKVVDDVSDALVSPVRVAAERMSEWLYRGSYWEGALTSQPISMDDIPVSADSNGQVRILLRAEGWAEGTATIDVDSGGMHELRLSRAGSVELRWVVPEALRSIMGASASWPAMGVRLQLEELGAKPPKQAASIEQSGSRWETAHATDTPSGVADVVKASFSGIAPGSYKAVLRLSSFVEPEAPDLALARFEVRADETSQVEMTTVPTLDPRALISRIRLEMPPEYGKVKELFLLMRRVEPKRDPERTLWTHVEVREISPSVWEAVLPQVEAGPYQFSVSIDPSVRVASEVQSGTHEPILVVIPTPYRYQIQLRSRVPEAPPRPRSISWRPGSSLESTPGTRVSESKGVYEVVTGSPEISVSLGAPCSTRLARGEWVQVKGGGEHFLDAVPGPCVRLVLHENGEPYDVGTSFGMVRARGPDGRKRPLDTRRVQTAPGAAHELLVWFREAGDHELELNSIPGFEPLAPLKLTVSEGPERIVHIDLVRKR